MKDVTVADVNPLYKKKYWDRVRGDDLPDGVDWAVFDWAVNSGTGRSEKHCKILLVQKLTVLSVT